MNNALKNVKKDIANYKQRLKRKAKKNGVWENFGEEEQRVLEQQYSDHKYKRDGVWAEIENFFQWRINYSCYSNLF